MRRLWRRTHEREEDQVPDETPQTTKAEPPGWQAQGFASPPEKDGLSDEERIAAMEEDGRLRGVSGPGYVDYTKGDTE
jgi:hypothetical protein